MTEQGSAWPAKAMVVGVPISCTSYTEVLDGIERRPRYRATVIAVCNVHSVMTARRDPTVAQALQAADIATPDGMPLVWMLRQTAHAQQARVYGPDLMRHALAYGRPGGWKHYFLGATPATLVRLVAAAQRIAPGVEVAGSFAPPHRPLTPDVEAHICADVRRSRADVVWVGLGMPKQELFMYRARDHLPGVALVGVGAAFDFLAGTVKEAPGWMQQVGLEWLYRLMREPRRLWRRYLLNNPPFMALAFHQLVAQRERGRVVHAHGPRQER